MTKPRGRNHLDVNGNDMNNKIVDGKILYCENFKEVGLKMYFDKDNLVYMKSTELDKIFNDVENALYTIIICYFYSI